MTTARRQLLVAAFAALVCVAALRLARGAADSALVEPRQAADALPARLTDQEFWRLTTAFSEPNGYFRSENLVSNEHTFQYVIPTLKRVVKPGGVYLGVAPDQNFSYIVAVQPRMAFIVDIRRGNLLELMMYKALIELSADRAEFVSRLFSKKRPAGLTPKATVVDLFTAFDKVETSEEFYRENVKAIEDDLVKRHGFALSPDDLQRLEGIVFAFFWDGPSIRYTSTPSGFGLRGFGGRGFNGGNFPSYEELMMQTDADGRSRSYLASEENFRFLKDLEERNLIVPIVGNFAGPKALRAVGTYVREHGATVSAFYVSNVEQYLFQDSLWPDFAQNVATLPVDDASVFIRSVSSRFGYAGTNQWSDGRASALDPIRAMVRDFQAGRIRSYYDVNVRSK
jgi:hypothetical protein